MNEFYKLTQEDQQVLLWLMEKSPKRIASYLLYVGVEYRIKRSVVINTEKIYNGLMALSDQTASVGDENNLKTDLSDG